MYRNFRFTDCKLNVFSLLNRSTRSSDGKFSREGEQIIDTVCAPSGVRIIQYIYKHAMFTPFNTVTRTHGSDSFFFPDVCDAYGRISTNETQRGTTGQRVSFCELKIHHPPCVCDDVLSGRNLRPHSAGHHRQVYRRGDHHDKQRPLAAGVLCFHPRQESQR